MQNPGVSEDEPIMTPEVAELGEVQVRTLPRGSMTSQLARQLPGSEGQELEQSQQLGGMAITGGVACSEQSPVAAQISYAEPLSVQQTVKSGRVGASTNDQRFLLIFILSNYFGPDLRTEEPKRSAAQRQATDAPPYTEAEVHNSILKLSEIESIYYFVIRQAHPAARVKLQSLYKFLQGHLAPPVREPLEDDRQFTDFFNPSIHKQTRYKGTYKVVEGVTFIDNPDMSSVAESDLVRFLRLTSLSVTALDREEARNFVHGMRTDRDEERQARFNLVTEQRNDKERGVANTAVGGLGGERGNRGEGIAIRKKRKKREEVDGIGASSGERGSMFDLGPGSFPLSTAVPPPGGIDVVGLGASLLLLPGRPSAAQWHAIVSAARPAMAFTGTAALRQSGPGLGGVDIGESDDAYLFRCALPGVKKDEGDFNCEVEVNGQVTIKGFTTTGAPLVEKSNRRFQMHSLNLCPPGPFTVAFHLPGPVEPSQFTGTFGADGILEGIVLKQRKSSGTASLTFLS